MPSKQNIRWPYKNIKEILIMHVFQMINSSFKWFNELLQCFFYISLITFTDCGSRCMRKHYWRTWSPCLMRLMPARYVCRWTFPSSRSSLWHTTTGKNTDLGTSNMSKSPFEYVVNMLIASNLFHTYNLPVLVYQFYNLKVRKYFLNSLSFLAIHLKGGYNFNLHANRSSCYFRHPS